jgi:hypothetical protein
LQPKTQPLGVLVEGGFSGLSGLVLEQLEQIGNIIGISSGNSHLRRSAHPEMAGNEASEMGAGRQGQTHEIWRASEVAVLLVTQLATFGVEGATNIKSTSKSTIGEIAMLISINDAVAQGITRLRKPIWASAFDHLKIDIIDGRMGPWFHLYAPFNKECSGRDPVDLLSFNADVAVAEWLPYTGSLPESDEYKAEQARFDGCLSGHE